MEIQALLRLALALSKRAESYEPSHLANSFVEIGNVPALLRNNDSAVVFGRRGTGKTHLLSYLGQQLRDAGFVVAEVDMRTIGSSSGLYADAGLALSERATRLLRDTAGAIHERILEAYTAPGAKDFGPEVIASLDELLDAANTVSVDGAVTREQAQQSNSEAGASAQLGFKFSGAGTTEICGATGTSDKATASESLKETTSGRPTLRINFAGLSSAIEKVVRNLPKRRIWILLDEWSEVPLDLQPYLADMLRRGFLAVRGVTTKIAAIEHRSAFRLVDESSQRSVGMELGADIAMSVNLDDHMVFDNDSRAASAFFAQVLYRHMRSISQSEGVVFEVADATELVRRMFTQRDAFDEFVRAAEGVPRDAINILSKCALKANSEKVSMPVVRDSARAWYATSKQNDVASRPRALELLDWIKREVIGNRRARGFLLDARSRDGLIDFLFDSRVLHLIKKGISSKDREDAGTKFNAWVLDYGCYVELSNTGAAPRGLFEVEEDEGASATKFVDVPQNDYRSLRRAILDLSCFYSAPNSIAPVIV